MKLLERLVSEWSGHGCGLTIDIVGDSQLSSELQWVLALPVAERSAEERLRLIESLRNDLEGHGLQFVESDHFDPAAALGNGTAIEPNCPYRPESCLGDHVIATGHGLVGEQALRLRPTDGD